nr:unnamed protein product [Spirometra erinaceieuropaei]
MEDLSWLTAPRDTYDKQFHPSATPALPLDAYENFIRTKISESSGAIIPLVTDDTLPHIPDGHLVCVRGMIQDMFDSELYISSYRPSAEATSVKSTRYRDVEYLQADGSLDEASITLSSRQSFYVSHIPGESSWIQATQPERLFLASPALGSKRCLSDPEMTHIPVKKVLSDAKFDEESTDTTATNEKNGVLLRVYNEKDAEKLKLTDLVFVYGILEHARLGSEPAVDAVKTGDEAAKALSCSSAKRRLPRVHAILVERSHFSNHPWLQVKWQTMGGWDSRDVLIATRARVIEFLRSVLSGDELAAEFLLLHLLSTSAVTSDSVFPITLPPLNISHWEKKLGADTERLIQSLHCILPQVSLIPLTVDSLNNGPLLMPVRDVAIDELDSGLLQLPTGSEVIVDETDMSSGQLTSRGVLNCRALTMLATQRKLTYDFQFYSQDWDSDVRVLILSTCASIIKPVLTVPWKPSTETTTRTSQVAPSESDLWQIRRYLLEVQQTGEDYSIEPDLQEVVNRDFVNWRKEKSTFIEAEDFAVMLCLLKLYVQSYGESRPTEEHWRSVVALETARKTRLKETTVN